MLRFIFLLVCIAVSSAHAYAQDTFYVKKKNPAAVQRQQQPVVYTDTTTKDSIVSYTAEYQKPGTNIYARIHMKGPYLNIPPDAQGQRVIFTEIIAVDKNGRKYRMPDRIYAGGYTVPVKEPTK